MLINKIISQVNNWSDFKNILESKTKFEKGKAFEELTKYYLEYNPVYKSKLKNVWLQSEIPPSILNKLKLPENDQGIDLIAETFEGKFWAIQCKYLQEEEQRLSHRAISTFVSLSRGIAENITYCLVFTNADKYAKIYHGKTNIGFCTSDDLRKLDKTFFDWIRSKLNGKEKKVIPYKPKSHQTKALKEAKDYFLKQKNSRGKLVFPCGAGKSLTGYWITRELKSKSIIVAVPSLSLVKQTLQVYLRESVANNEKISWLCVCSDEGIGKNDDVAIHTNELGVPCITDKNFIANWLKENTENKTIIFTTYQSGKTIAEACKIANHSFNLGILDEAHKTVGDRDKLFSHLLFEQNISVEKRIFMTATERRYTGSSDTILSMNDISVYGEIFAQMSFKKAIEIGILSDYKIITLFISNAEVKKLIQQNAYVKPEGKDWDEETEARTLASLIALRKAITDYPIYHAVTFHSSIKKAEAFDQSQSLFSKAHPQFANVKSFHVSGTMPTSVRGKIVDEFAETEKGIITNAKCLTEGIDVPNIDCVLFADPRKSKVDIVQAVGRALRKKEGKECGYVILPVLTNTTNTDEIIESNEFQEVLTTLRALASNDERIIEYFRDISKGKKSNQKDSLIQFDIDVNIASKINAQDLIDSIQLKTWNKLAKLSWMPFDEAREFVRNLYLKSMYEWKLYCQNQNRPFDIPSNPWRTYKLDGYNGINDWLGVKPSKYNPPPFKDYEYAHNYLKKLNLTTAKDYKNYIRSGKLPIEIPSSPYSVYKNKGWISWGDYLGSNTKRNGKELNFKIAREEVRKLNLKSNKEFRVYCKNEKEKNDGIPTNPDKVYNGKGWISWSDWLGTKNIATNQIPYKSYDEAKVYARKNKINSGREWMRLYTGGKIPRFYPKIVYNTYKHQWKGWADFLGT
jgi:predicted helicase